jgi:hypothetical protein
MSLKRSISALVFVAALGGQTMGLDAMITQFEAQANPTPQQLQQNLLLLSGGLKSGHAAGSSPRVRDYLGRVQGLAGGNRSLSLAMSGVYRQLGSLEMSPQLAWLNYRNAFLMLNQFPMDNQIRGEMQQLRKSIEVVEARMPELPKLDWSTLDAASQKEYDDVMTRYISVTSAASSAEVMAETMRRSMASQGLALRPEVISGLTRMKLKVEDAKRLIEQKNYDGARERLSSAEAEAQKILKSFGG